MTDKTLIELVAKDYGMTKKQAKEFINQCNKEELKAGYSMQCKLSFYND